ncbi:MAG: hypothetical protein N3A58_08870 [Spirochaetes bacterium]|nr:hypothetical protein [Spirochaetota bacterium]
MYKNKIKKIKYFIFFLIIIILFFYYNHQIFSNEFFIISIVSNYDLIINNFKFKPYTIIYNDQDSIHELLSIKNSIKEIKKRVKGDLLLFINFDSIGLDIIACDLNKEKKLFSKKFSSKIFPYFDKFILDFLEDINFLYKFYKNYNFNFMFFLGINNFEIIYNYSNFLSFFKTSTESDLEMLIRNYLINNFVRKENFEKFFKENEINNLYSSIKKISSICKKNLDDYIDKTENTENFKIFNFRDNINFIIFKKSILDQKIILLLKEKYLNYLDYKLINFIFH